MLSVLFALPFVACLVTTVLSLIRFYDHADVLLDAVLESGWDALLHPGLILVLVFSFLAYRAQSKLTLIDHLKHHLETEPSEPAAGQKGDRVRVSA